MLRSTIFKTRKPDPVRGFRNRGHDVKRIETFSDAVFAFAVTLLIVSLEVPKTFEELLVSMRGFGAFAICFTLLMLVWHEQNVFFRRYALDDKVSILLNASLIFIVLFYVYPLKFLFTLLFSDSIYPAGKNPFSIRDDQAPQLMVIYGVGYVAIYAIFFFLYFYALRKKVTLELNRFEVFDTRTRMYGQLVMAAAGVCSILLALCLSPKHAGLSWVSYLAIGPALWLVHGRRGVIRRRMLKQE
jgi:uncharacterized membrane protein